MALMLHLLFLLLVALAICRGEPESCGTITDTLKILQDQRGFVVTVEDQLKQPIRGTKAEFCTNLHSTCCNRGLERKLAEETRINFKHDISFTLQRISNNYCENMNPHFPDLVMLAIKESVKNSMGRLIKETKLALSSANTENSFPLLRYLEQFSTEHDLCSLSSTIDSQLLQVAKLLFPDQSNSECLELVVNKLKIKYKASIEEALKPVLGRIKYLISGNSYIKRAIQNIQTYKVSPYCVKELMQMTFCAPCGGVSNLKICHNFCMNTIQGCLVDFSDLHSSLHRMLLLLKKIQSQLLSTHTISQAMHKVNKNLLDYVQMLSNSSESIRETLQLCTPLHTKRAVGNDKDDVYYIPNVIDSIPAPTGNAEEILNSAMARLFKCIHHQLIVITEIPKKICSDRYLIQKDDNRECWTGFNKASYTKGIADYSRQGLETNPVFQNVQIPASSNKLNSEIKSFIQNIEESLEPCLPDDEDCVGFMHDCSEISYSGSGSGPIESKIFGRPSPLNPNRTGSTFPTVPTHTPKVVVETEEPDRSPGSQAAFIPSYSVVLVSLIITVWQWMPV